jgi:spore maturation protein CgeB
VRVLIAATVYEDSFAENVEVTLRTMGHDVLTLGHSSHAKYWSLPRYAVRVLRECLAGDRPVKEERRLLSVAKSYRPELLLCLTKSLHPEVLHELGRVCPGRRVLWWGDSPGNSQRWGVLDAGWDWIYLKDADAVSKLRLVGRNAHLMHEAMNPMWHRPVAEQASENVAIVGNSYAFRQAIAVRLMEAGVALALYGPRPPIWSDPGYRRAHLRTYVVKDEKSRVFGEALGCLNTFSLSEGNSLNCRAFEIAGAGGLQYIEARPAIQDCFEPGREVLTFKTFEELCELISRSRRDATGARETRARGLKRALSEHTYRHRLTRMLGHLGAK